MGDMTGSGGEVLRESLTFVQAVEKNGGRCGSLVDKKTLFWPAQ